MEKKLGTRIRELRIDKGLTQPQLAQEIGVAKSVISNWEINLNEPKAKYIKALADFFGVSADYLLGLEDLLIENKVIENPESRN